MSAADVQAKLYELLEYVPKFERNLPFIHVLEETCVAATEWMNDEMRLEESKVVPCTSMESTRECTCPPYYDLSDEQKQAVLTLAKSLSRDEILNRYCISLRCAWNEVNEVPTVGVDSNHSREIARELKQHVSSLNK